MSVPFISFELYDLQTESNDIFSGQVLMTMLYPTGSALDNSPIHLLCCNDTCSFTWTGAEHINQDIFECRTCGLLGSLCCCTECARVCHKGHDCKWVIIFFIRNHQYSSKTEIFRIRVFGKLSSLVIDEKLPFQVEKNVAYSLLWLLGKVQM